MVKSDLAVVVSRLKREDCERITHDRDFSKWKILVGPSDWEDYSLGKDGAARYRVQNLPGSSSPGVYELAIAVSHTGLGRKIEKLDPEHIVVVYLGQAENLRTRLQHYGRNGAHLANSYSTSHPTDCKTDSLQNGPGLFEEILSRGYPIVFRWAPGLSNVYTKKQANLYAHCNISGATFYNGDHELNNSINNSNFIGTMQNKSDAHKTETKLLNKFDYAWNTSINGSRRPDDILQKLRKVSSSSNRFPVIQWLLPFSQKKVGTRIKASKLLSTENNFNTCADEESPDIPSRVFKFGRSQPRLVVDRGGITEENTAICGVTIAEDSVCRRPPVKGRKRCAEHKGMKINGNLGLQHGVIDKRESDSLCAPSFKHEGASLPLVTVKYPVCGGFSHICGFILSDGSPCIMQPLKGNRRCEEHKGRRINKLLSTENNFNTRADAVSPYIPSRVFEFGRSQPRLVVDRGGITEENSVICGVTIAEDSVCRRPPVKGRKRCAEHKGMKINGNRGLQHGVIDKRESDSHCAPSFKHEGASLPLVTVKYPVCEGFSHICGFISSDGSPCIMQPLKGNRRCEEHKGRRINKLLSTENNFNTRADAVSPYIPSRVFEFGRSQPRLVVDRGGITGENSVICGVTIAGDSVCRRPPVKGRRRCAEHKGMKINGNLGLQHGVIDKRESDSHCARSFRHEGAWLPPVTVKYPVCEGFSHICGFILSDGSPCIRQPLKGNKRCAAHKGRRIR